MRKPNYTITNKAELSIEKELTLLDGDMDQFLFVSLFKDMPNVSGKRCLNNNNVEEVEKVIFEGLGNPDPRFFRQHFRKKGERELFPNMYYVYPKDKLLIVNKPRFLTLYTHPETALEIVDQAQLILESFPKWEEEAPKIRLLCTSHGGLGHSSFDMRVMDTDLAIHYEDGVVQDYGRMVEQMNTHSSGLWILHGAPGTGKTSLIRHLIKEVNEPCLFIPPHMLHLLSSPDLTSYFLEHPNQILIIEDAENLVINREEGGGAIVSVLLNLADGLLGDALKVKIICTMNLMPEKIDPAILRPGRLKQVVSVDPLSANKADALLTHLGHEPKGKEMTLGEIYSQEYVRSLVHPKTAIGFR